MGKREDFQFERETLALHKAALGVVFIQKASEVEDQQRNTDVELVIGACRFGCRTRHDEDTRRHWRGGPDITIRWSRPSGRKTEHEKFTEGWGDYLSYGLVSRPAGRWEFTSWVVIDLGALRRQLQITCLASPTREIRHNRDGTELAAFKTLSMWPECIHAAYGWPVTKSQAKSARLLPYLPGAVEISQCAADALVLADADAALVCGQSSLFLRGMA